MNRKAETITLTTLLTLVLAAGILIAGINITSNLFKQEINNAGQPAQLAEAITRMQVNAVGAEDRMYEERYLAFAPLDSRELLLFFSSGKDPIRLSHYAPDPSAVLKNSVPADHYLEFTRPEECEDKACVCNCRSGNPLWSRAPEEPYLGPAALRIGTADAPAAFSCGQYMCQEVVSSTPVEFTNSRGYFGHRNFLDNSKSAFVNSYIEKIDAENDRDGYFPIPMDIVLLVQNHLKVEQNFFFNPTCSVRGTEDYNADCQDDDIVEALLHEYTWSGGVVIGGSGAANSETQQDNKQLAPVPTQIHIEDYGQGLFGVCLIDRCIEFVHQPKALEEMKKKEELKQLFDSNLQDHFLAYYVYLRGVFTADLQAGRINAKQFEERTTELFKQTSTDTLQSELHFIYENQKTYVQLIIKTEDNQVASEKFELDFAFPTATAGEQLPSPQIVTQVRDGKITSRGEEYTLGYSAAKRTLQFNK